MIRVFLILIGLVGCQHKECPTFVYNQCLKQKTIEDCYVYDDKGSVACDKKLYV